ncbi:MAG TPA: hypothetical protein VGC95_11330 [Chitinophagaceae bacterium]
MGDGIYILPNLLYFKAGDGRLFVQLTPLAFSNYFLLYQQNIAYYNKVLSLIPEGTSKIVWDEYFRQGKSSPGSDNHSFLAALFRQRSFRAAILAFIALAALFALQEMRRKQRMIREIAKPRNDSLEFVKTIGRLYYEKKDNRNLSQKMAAYFLEYVRNRYKMSTTALDKTFVTTLHWKSMVPETEIVAITGFINGLHERTSISDGDLAAFHERLEKFYNIA